MIKCKITVLKRTFISEIKCDLTGMTLEGILVTDLLEVWKKAKDG